MPEYDVTGFARIVARLLLIEIAIATSIEGGELAEALEACWLCGSELRAHERPERICDVCLRANQSWPKAA